ncbi:DUF1588 domain-containing protein [Alienimonas californiensis]|uniref:PA14 domain protein n=1 Tax=Alienimonas californiensis TaxID=2527989 RepID=A0A517P8J8_9PLAN|nr:DUF1588 domain-containing protein [Alienimonas californiensis]QDT15697.1 PA14 domain protein [Alienimonas californiensis]
MHLPVSIRPSRTAVALACAFAALLAAGPSVAAEAEAERGAELFARVCAECHGAKGEGVEFLYESPLHGDLSVDQLADLIARTMPEEDPGSVVGEDAAAVAAFAYDAFYSRNAQLRNAPPRVELSRLTGSQYRRSIAALGATFAGHRDLPADAPHGLAAQYRARTGPWDKRLAFKRTEPVIDVDLGDGVPKPNEGDETGPSKDKLQDEGFEISWEGALLPPVTGVYKFAVESSHQVEFDLNGTRLVNVRVRSGDQTRYECEAFLLGGQPVPLRMRTEKRLGKEFNTDAPKIDFAARLSWTPPHRTEAVVPARNLLPGWTPPALLVSTPFPPDDRSVGYERGSAVSAAWDEATSEAAFEIADLLLESDDGIRTYLKINDKDPADKQVQKAKEFCAKWAERAFRRPLTDEQRALYVDAHFDGDRHWKEATKRCVLMTLKSPHFLYPNLHAAIAAASGEAPDGYDRAAALALFLWDSLPDDHLHQAAQKGWLNKPEDVAKEANRMSKDYRATVKLTEFFAEWLIPEGAHEMAKDETMYPGFDHAAVGDLRTSLELTIADALAGENADFRSLWNAEDLYVNARLAELYKDDLVDPGKAPQDGTFVKLAVKPERRAGLLTHPLLMAGYAHHRVTSPIHRGVFVARKLLGRNLKPPKEAFSPLPEDFGDGLTTRERVAHQTSDVACSACHNTINPLGFSLERFDAIGRYRTEEQVVKKDAKEPVTKPVDPSGVYVSPEGAEVPLDGAVALSRFIADSPEARTAFVERLFHHAVKQPTAAYGLETRETLAAQFEEQETNMKAAFAAAATVAAIGPPQDASARTAAAHDAADDSAKN